MKILVAEEDFTSRRLLEKILQNYSIVQTAVNGRDAIKAVRDALEPG